jgi:VRR-NUC domain
VALRRFVGCVGPYRDPPTYLRGHEPEDLRANPRSICSKKRWVVRVGAPNATEERMCVVQQVNGSNEAPNGSSGGKTTGDRARLPNRREQDLRRALADHLRARVQPNISWFQPDNGSARTAIEGAILKACGVRAGTFDLILVRDGKTFALELKAAGGRLSPAQREAHDELRRAGAEVATAVGVDDAIGQLERWQLLRGSVQ